MSSKRIILRTIESRLHGSSASRSETATFTRSCVIRGWGRRLGRCLATGPSECVTGAVERFRQPAVAVTSRQCPLATLRERFAATVVERRARGA